MTEKKVYLLLTDTGSFLTKLIKLYTNKTYNHASISFDSELSEVYSFGRKNARNPFNGGFVKEDTKSGLFENATCAVYSLTISEAAFEKMKCYVRQMEEQKDNYHYNFLGLFGFLTNQPIERENAFFCSQFVASVLDAGNVTTFNKPLSLIAPNDLETIKELDFEYEGDLKEYHNVATEPIFVPNLNMPIEV